jgi:hypothetical protein
MKSSKFKSIVLNRIPTAVFNGEKLVTPFPNIKMNGVIRVNDEVLQLAVSKFSYSSVIDAMLNKKIVIML